jgi:uncharacterized membrane protein YfcA
MIESAGYIATAFIGLSLGFIGAGGSILCVPVMVYLFSIKPLEATTYSLFVVGLSSAVGAVSNYRKKLVQLDVAMTMGLFSVAGVFITRSLIMPAIPSNLGTIGHYTIKKSFASMVLFAALMLCASFSMTRRTGMNRISQEGTRKKNRIKLSLCGAAIGVIAGLSGIGGGFLLIPGLVLFAGLPMREAVATSLLIITMNCLVGFAADAGHFVFDWNFLLRLTAFAICGIFAGIFLSRKVRSPDLKRIFGYLVMLIGSGILIKEIFT